MSYRGQGISLHEFGVHYGGLQKTIPNSIQKVFVMDNTADLSNVQIYDLQGRPKTEPKMGKAIPAGVYLIKGN